jgi:hypothetical protein
LAPTSASGPTSPGQPNPSTTAQSHPHIGDTPTGFEVDPFPIQRSDEAEAVAMANDTKYGLATSIYTQDISRASRLATKIEVGLCWINSWFLRDLRTAFGGSKSSGIGREGGVHSLEFYTELRNVMVKY